MYNSQNLPLSPLKVIKKSIPAIILNLVVFGGIIGFIAIIDSYDGDPLTSSLSEARTALRYAIEKLPVEQKRLAMEK